MTQKFFILRHGQTLFNAEHRLQGHCNSALTETGQRQAEYVGSTLKTHITPAHAYVYSSTLGRAVETAHVICEKIGFNVSNLRLEDRLKEFALGQWEHRTIPSLIVDHPTLTNTPDWYLRAPDAEPYEAVQTRLTDWLQTLPEKGDIIVITHGLTGVVLRGILLKLTYEQVWQQEIPQDAFFIVEQGKIKRVNCLPSS